MSNNAKSIIGYILFVILLIALYKLTFAQDQVPVTNGYGTATASTALKTINSIPSGAIVFFDSGSCPSGFTEVSGLNGKYILGTVSANSNVGTTGGSNSYTPAGSVAAPTFTGSAGTVPAQTFTGDSNTTSATSAGTPAGSVSAPTFTGSSGTVPAETFT